VIVCTLAAAGLFASWIEWGMSSIKISGVNVAYHDTGAPEGVPDAPTVMFGHGLLFGGWMFRAQVESLRDRYRCVTIDWRGQGESQAARDGYDMDTLTSDAAELITRLGVAPVHWVGLSMGGFVGQRLAARHGELIRSLTLLDTSADAEEPARVQARRRLALLQLFFGLRPILDKVKPLLFGPAFLADPGSEEVISEWLERLGRTRRTAVRKAVIGVAERAPVAAELGRITVPALVVVGADDHATPVEHARRIASGIPGAQLLIVPDCGHSSALEQPDVISALLAEFLSGAAALAR
jgi:3-oxoadipate enol-lactonase